MCVFGHVVEDSIYERCLAPATDKVATVRCGEPSPMARVVELGSLLVVGIPI